MSARDSTSTDITPELLLRAYACGIFPMSESADDPHLFWVEPELRGVIPLEGFRVSSRLARTVRSNQFAVTVDRAFKRVMSECAAPKPDREDTWINKRIRDLIDGVVSTGVGAALSARGTGAPTVVLIGDVGGHDAVDKIGRASCRERV